MYLHLKKMLVGLLIFSLLTLGLQSVGFANVPTSYGENASMAVVAQDIVMSSASFEGCDEMDCCSSQSCQSGMHCSSVSALAFPTYDIGFDRSVQAIVIDSVDSSFLSNLVLSIYRPPWA